MDIFLTTTRGAEQSANAALDNNLLMLWLAGNVDLLLLRTFKRVQQFTVDDYGLLRVVLNSVIELFTTPHVLAETSNFVEQAPLYCRGKLVVALESFIENTTELVSPARDLARLPEFELLGLKDTGLSDLARTATVITMDYRLHGKIEANGDRCINFNHLRRFAE